MKRLLTISTLLLLTLSCTKETDISQGEMSGEAVKFTASVVDVTDTKATLINSWSGGEEVVLFVDDTPYRYSIAADGSMTGDEIIVERDKSITYTAFYPYDESLTTIEEYESACVSGSVDYMKAITTTSGKEVSLQFEHLMAALSFTIFVEGRITDPAISLALDGNFNNAIALDLNTTLGNIASKLEATYFVADGTDISSAIIKLEQSGSTTLHPIKRGDSNTLEVGKQYPFSYTIGDVPTGSGSGTSSSPYLIYTADDMRKVGTGTDGWDMSSDYLMVWDIDLESVEFTAIGTPSSNFKGTFDGGGNKINGLYINTGEEYQGLFGFTYGATIKNLGVSGSVTGYQYVGGVVGYINNKSMLTNCYSSCSVKASSTSTYVGGIVGRGYNYSTIKYCYYIGSVDASTNFRGAIAGSLNSTCTVSYCYYNCNVSGAVNSSDGTNYCSLTTEMMKGDAETEGTLLYYFKQGGSTSWVEDTENINNGYPILTWQTSNN